MPVAPSKPSQVLSYSRLFRLPNVFTAAADVTMGYLFVRQSLSPWPAYCSLLAASCLLYTSGMVLNDVFDFAVDSRQRPQRPLPSGQISLGRAKTIGYSMLVAGAFCAWLAGLWTTDSALPWRSGYVATLLVGSILLYDAVLKQTPAGPIIMGLCRMLNVLLGMSVARQVDYAPEVLLRFDSAQLMVALGIGTYIAGVTWFARTEATESRRGQLLLGVVLMIAGISLLAVFPNYGDFGAGFRNISLAPDFAWPALILLIGFSIVRRCFVAIADPTPASVQVAVKQCILSLIVLDASVCLAVRTPIWWAVGILALILPTLVLGKWVYST